jgi:streptomycin 6-kinase
VQTASSLLLPVTRADGTPAVLKLLKPGSDEAGAGAVLDYFGAEGAVRVHAWDDRAQLLERLEAPDALIEMVRIGDDDAAARAIGEVVSRLHAPRTAAPPASLIPLDDRFRSLFARQGSLPVLGRGATLAYGLLASSTGRAVLHGDIHHGNVLRRPDGAWAAIDPKGVLGEPAYDLANTICNPVSLPHIATSPERALRQAAILAETVGVDRTRLLAFAFAHACLSASWEMDEGGDPTFGLTMAEVLEPLVT